MMHQALRVTALSLALCSALVGCTAGRDNFYKEMGGDIGKSADDPSTYRVRHPGLRVGMNKLSNGHLEEEYQTGFRLNCRVFFEIDGATQKIVNWRYGQPDDDCILPAPAEAPPGARR
jgi:hypothetical protein